MNRSRVTGDLASHGNIFVDIANDRVGIGSTIPGEKLSLPDNAKIALGDSADLEIYHDGSHSYIHDGGTGNLKLRSNNFRLSNADESKLSATFQASGAAELYHDNAKKLETTAYGIDVTGTTGTDGLVVSGVSTFAGNIDANGDLDVDGHTNLDNVNIAGITTINGGKLAIGNVVPSKMLELYSGSTVASMHESAGASYVEAQFKNSARHYIVGLRPDQSSAFCILDNTSGSGGVLLKASGHTVTLDHDLDVDGHTDLDNVSIAGVTTVSNKTQVNSIGIGIIPIDHHHIHIESANPRILIRSTGTNAAKILFGDNSSNDPGVIEYAHSENSMRFNTGNLERLRLDSSGRLRVASTTESADGAFDDVIVGNHSGNRGISILSGATSQGAIGFAKSGTLADGYVAYNHNSTATDSSMILKSSGRIQFNAGSSERLRITSGGVVNIGANNLSQTTYKAQIETGTNRFISFTNAAHDDFSNEASAIIFSRVSDGAKELSGIFQHSTTSFGIATRGNLTLHAGGTGTYSGSPERVRILNDGKVLIGHTSNIFNYKLAIFGTDGGNSGIAASRFSNNTSPASLILSKSRSATIGNFAVLQNNDEVGMIDFRGADGTDNNSKVAEIKACVDGTPGSNDMPGRLQFHTTVDGASTTTERLRITSNGKINVGNAISSNPWTRTGNTNTGVRLAETTTGYAISANSNDIVAIFNRTSGVGNGTILELKYDNVVVASLASNFNSFSQNITIDSNASASLALDRANTSSGAVIDFKTNNSLKWYMGLRGLVNDNFYIRNESGSTDALTILTNGRVGVNHTAPTAPLDVKGADDGINIRSDSNDRPHLNMINGSTTMLRISCNGSVVDFGDANSTARYATFDPESDHSIVRMNAQTYVKSPVQRSSVFYHGAGFQYRDDSNNDHPVLHVQATSNGGGVNNIVCPNSKIIINGKSIGGSGRSWKLTVIKGSGSNIGQVIHHQTYDVYGTASKATDYVNALSTYTTDNNLIIVTTSDEPERHATSIREALRDTYGAKDSIYNHFRYAYAFAFRHGFGTLGEQNSIYWSALNTRSGTGQNNIKTIACINFTVCL